MVKRCGKSAPRPWQHGWQAKPRTEQGQIGRRYRTARPKPPGRPLDPVSNAGARGMIVTPRCGRKGVTRGTEFGLRSPAADFFLRPPHLASKPHNDCARSAWPGSAGRRPGARITGPNQRAEARMAHFLVTGGAGFIGSHLTEEVARRG